MPMHTFACILIDSLIRWRESFVDTTYKFLHLLVLIWAVCINFSMGRVYAL